MPKNVVILGAGGHAKVIADIVLLNHDHLLGFLDDNPEKQNQTIFKNYKVIGTLSDAEKYQDCFFIIAIGDNHTRAKIASQLSNYHFYTAVHPSATIADTVKIGEGTVIMAGTTINADTKVGNHCVINTMSSLDHDSIIEDFTHISPGAHLAGTVSIGKYSWICTGASVINNLTIGRDVILGAGATAISDLPTAGTYVGTPARRIK